jgi:hypothetical protein
MSHIFPSTLLSCCFACNYNLVYISMDLMSAVSAQGVYSGQVERRLLDSWNWMVCFKDAVYSLAFQVTRQCEHIGKNRSLAFV